MLVIRAQFQLKWTAINVLQALPECAAITLRPLNGERPSLRHATLDCFAALAKTNQVD
jgi:hypothetical protein